MLERERISWIWRFCRWTKGFYKLLNVKDHSHRKAVHGGDLTARRGCPSNPPLPSIFLNLANFHAGVLSKCSSYSLYKELPQIIQLEWEASKHPWWPGASGCFPYQELHPALSDEGSCGLCCYLLGHFSVNFMRNVQGNCWCFLCTNSTGGPSSWFFTSDKNWTKKQTKT